jgi:class 3 adenylate cyclase/tetratricopeptide (TPR) repeat protein
LAYSVPSAHDRRLTAILAMDVVGYSRMMEADEDTALAFLSWLYKSLVEPRVAAYRGRIFKTMGDGLLIEFASAADALDAGVEIQQSLATIALEVSTGEPVRLRIGIHIGDVVRDGSDLLGDGVNVAARLEAIAEPGGLYVSRSVRDSAHRTAQVDFEDLGEWQVKNISRPIHVFRVLAAGLTASEMVGPLAGAAEASRRAWRSMIAATMVTAIVIVAVAAAAAMAWQRDWFNLSPARPAPWSVADMRQTFAISSMPVSGDDAALRDYADGLVEALSALFTANFGPERLLPATGTAGQAHFTIDIKVRRSGLSAVSTVSLTDTAAHDQLFFRSLTEPVGQPLDAQRGEMMRLATDLKWAATEREQMASEVVPAEKRDARDLIILSKFARQSEAGIKRRVALVQQAAQLAPDDPNVQVETATILSWGAANGLAVDVASELEQSLAASEQVLARSPDQLMALRALANVYIAQSRFEDEIVATDRMLAVSHNDSWALEEQCFAQLKLGRDDQAAATLERVLPLDSSFFVAGLATAVRFDQSRYDEAASWARKALQLLPAGDTSKHDRAGWNLYLAAAEALDGREENAVQALADFQALAPDIHRTGDLLSSDFIVFPMIARSRLLDGLRKAGFRD